MGNIIRYVIVCTVESLLISGIVWIVRETYKEVKKQKEKKKCSTQELKKI